MSKRRRTSPLALGCAGCLLLLVLLVILVAAGVWAGLVQYEVGGSATLPNGAVVKIETDGWGFGVGENPGETFIQVRGDTYVFSQDRVRLGDDTLGTLDPAEKSLTLRARKDGVELRSDDTGRVIFID